jgi:hypothetical protein
MSRILPGRSAFASVVLAAAATALASPAPSAQLVTIELQGQVTSVNDPSFVLSGSINVGDPMTGHYTYDLSTPDVDPAPDLGEYHQDTAPGGMVVTISGVNFRSNPLSPELVLVLANDNGAPPVDIYSVLSFNNLEVFPFVAVSSMEWQLVDIVAAALNSAALTAAAPQLSAWTFKALTISGLSPFGQFSVIIDITSASSSVAAPAVESSQRHPGSAGFFPVHRSGLAGLGTSGGHGSGGGGGIPFFTIVSVTNTDTQPAFPGSLGGSTNVHYEYVNVTANPANPFLPLACNIFDRVEFLTPADTLSVLTNCHNAIAPGGQSGYLMVSAQDPTQFAVDWSHNDLIGSELVVNGSGGMYEVAMISLVSPVPDGESTNLADPSSGLTNGALDFNGQEYAALPDVVSIDSFVALAGSRLALANLTGGLSARNTLAIQAWNDNEFPLSATRTFACWFDEPLSLVSPLFTQAFLAQNTPDDPDELDVDCNGTGDLETAWAHIDSIDVSYPFGGQIASDGVVLGAVTSGPGSLINGGTLLWESVETQTNGSIGE